MCDGDVASAADATRVHGSLRSLSLRQLAKVCRTANQNYGGSVRVRLERQTNVLIRTRVKTVNLRVKRCERVEYQLGIPQPPEMGACHVGDGLRDQLFRLARVVHTIYISFTETPHSQECVCDRCVRLSHITHTPNVAL